MNTEKKRLAVFASGRGSNAAALYEAIQQGEINGEIVVIITDKLEAAIIEKAAQWGIPCHKIVRADFMTKEGYELQLLETLQPYKVDGIVLAGFMRLLGETFITPYEHKILNIHPALLPSFPGLHAQRQAVEAGVKISGCTVHFVDSGMDSGPIIMQAAVSVESDDTEDTLAARILPQEHATYKKALALFCEDKLEIRNHVVHILP